MGKASSKLIDPTPIGKIEANLTFQTPSQNLAYLNTTKGWSEATYPLVFLELKVKEIFICLKVIKYFAREINLVEMKFEISGKKKKRHTDCSGSRRT
jgi:hypothetical protein